MRSADHRTADRCRWPILTGSLVRLRPVELSDLPMLLSWRSDPSAYGSFFEFEPTPLSAQEDWYRRHCLSGLEKNFIIETTLETHPIPIGLISILNINWRSRHAELGRLLLGNRTFRGLGHAPEAIALICEYAFDHMNLNKVYCEVLVSQGRVISLHKKFGVVEEGLRKEHIFKRGAYEDVVILALFRDEYLKRNRFASIRETISRRRRTVVDADCTQTQDMTQVGAVTATSFSVDKRA